MSSVRSRGKPSVELLAETKVSFRQKEFLSEQMPPVLPIFLGIFNGLGFLNTGQEPVYSTKRTMFAKKGMKHQSDNPVILQDQERRCLLLL